MSAFNFCPYCGTQLQHEGARFCPSCGQGLTDDQGGEATRGSVSRGCHISGTVVDTRGQPLAGAEIQVSGGTLAGEGQTFTARSDDQGLYSRLVPRGVYTIRAALVTTYQGERWRLRLHPADGDDDSVSAGPTPIMKDFQWRLTGLIPGSDPTYMESYYGAHIWLRCNGDDDGIIGALLRGKSDETIVCTFTLTPIGPLIDGTEGTNLTMTRTVKALQSDESNVELANTPNLYDIPIGHYRMTATLSAPGLLDREMVVPLNADGEEWSESINVNFEPKGGVWGAEQNIILVGLPG